jgi:hypothetical protein
MGSEALFVKSTFRLPVPLAFVGALHDPVRNRWLFEFGTLASLAVLPWAAIFGCVRGIPVWWRVIDASFGVAAFVPAWLGHRWTGQLERERARDPGLG